MLENKLSTKSIPKQIYHHFRYHFHNFHQFSVAMRSTPFVKIHVFFRTNPSFHLPACAISPTSKSTTATLTLSGLVITSTCSLKSLLVQLMEHQRSDRSPLESQTLMNSITSEKHQIQPRLLNRSN